MAGLYPAPCPGSSMVAVTEPDPLIAAGTPAKVAITGIMRKLVILAKALIRDKRLWGKSRP